MNDDVTHKLDAVNTEIARQLEGCEDRLRVIVQEYNAWVQTGMFTVLDQAARAQVENAVRAYITTNTERIRTAKAGFDALKLAGVPQAAPGLASQDPLAAMGSPPVSNVDTKPTVRLGLQPAQQAVACRNDDPNTIPEPEADCDVNDRPNTIPCDPNTDDADFDADFASVAEPNSLPEQPPKHDTSTSVPATGVSDGRPIPRSSSVAPVPVKNQDGFSRAAGPDFDDAPIGGRRVVRAARQHDGGATIRSVGQEEMLAGEVASAAIGTPAGVNPDDLVTSGISLSPYADFDKSARDVKQRQREHKKATSPDARPYMHEAEILDDEKTMVGLALGVRRHGKQFLVEQIELHLENLGLEECGDDPASILRAIIKLKRRWIFQGTDKMISAIIAHVNVCGFDESDDSVLVLQDVGLVNARR